MDEALVEHAQHDVDVTIAARISSSSLDSEASKRGRGALEGGDEAVRQADVRLAPGGSPSTAAPSEAPGAVSNEIVVAGNCARWLISSGPGFCSMCAIATERHLAGGGRR